MRRNEAKSRRITRSKKKRRDLRTLRKRQSRRNRCDRNARMFRATRGRRDRNEKDRREIRLFVRKPFVRSPLSRMEKKTGIRSDRLERESGASDVSRRIRRVVVWATVILGAGWCVAWGLRWETPRSTAR